MVTGTGPTISSNTMRVSSPVSGNSPRAASTCAVPTVGCPANGSSPPGVKIRTFRVLSGSSAGRTNVVSEKLNSRAMAAISPVERPRASCTTPSWFPPNARVVKTSAVVYSYRRTTRQP